MLTGRNVGLSLFAVVVAMLLAAPAARAADDATGTWKWTQQGRNNQSREVTLKLKQDGEKLTGTISGRNNEETEIQDGKVKDGEVSFKVVRKGQNGQEFSIKYSGKLSGDTIKGKSEFGSGDQARPRDWEAKRAKA